MTQAEINAAVERPLDEVYDTMMEVERNPTGAFMATGLYLRNLPDLVPTNRLTPPAVGTDEHRRWSAIHRCPPGPDRWKIRSKTFPGMADAWATQWTTAATERAHDACTN